MPLEDEVNQFISWGANLGIPLNKMPDQNALRSMFQNSRESTIFFNLMQKIRPYEEVENVQKNILVTKLDKLKNQLIPISQRHFAPKELQRYLKVEDLLKEKAEIDAKLKKAKEKCNLKEIQMKNNQKIKMMQKRESLRTKVTILKLKSESLLVQKQKELDNQKKIESVMPVKFTSFKSNGAVANKAVKYALKELDEFYKTSLNDEENDNITEAKKELWDKLRNCFSTIPNSVIWNIVVKMKDEQIQQIMDLNSISCDNIVSFQFRKITGFDIQLLRAKTSIITMVSKYINLLQNKNEANENFTVASKTFVAAIRNKLNMFPDANTTLSGNIDEIISDFMLQYCTRIVNKAKNDILIAEIDRYKTLSEEGHRNLEEHAICIKSLKEIYSDTETLIQRVQNEISQLNEIKDKIRYSKGLLQCKLRDMHNYKHQNNSQSFDLDEVLCSTKLDLDSSSMSNLTMRSENTTMMGNNTIGVSPTATNELTLFYETPLENFKTSYKPELFYLSPNPILLAISDNGTLKFCPHSILTANGSLQFIKKQFEWYSKMRNLSNELESNIQIDQINFDELKLTNKKQIDEATEILDKIKICGIKTNLSLSKATKFYRFALSNCLKDFIPNTKLLKNQSYADYEAEYTLYYRMATVGSAGKN